MDQKRAVLGLKVVLWVSAAAPGAWLVAGLLGLGVLGPGALGVLGPDVDFPRFAGLLGANPTEKLTHVTGMTTLVLLLVTLSVTPIRRFTGWNPVIRLRRPLGLFAFFYALSHFSIWLIFYTVFDVTVMVEDIVERPYITVGFSAFLILIPMALTSTKGWIRRLGKRWRTLHRGIYIAAILGVVHFYWLVKADTRLPLFLGGCLIVLLALRIPALAKKRPVRGPAAKTGTSASGVTR